MKALEIAMDKRGWSIQQTALITGVTDQSIRNLLRIGETRQTIPANVTAFTMLRLCEAFPTLELQDFLAGTTLRLVRRRAKEAKAAR